MSTYTDPVVSTSSGSANSGTGTLYTAPTGKWARVSLRISGTAMGDTVVAAGVTLTDILSDQRPGVRVMELILTTGETITYTSLSDDISYSALEYSNP